MLSNLYFVPCLQEVVSEHLSSRAEATDDLIREQSRIYGRDPSKRITHYHERINEASFSIAKKNPKLDHRNLLKLAQQQLYESGYQYKKGKSCSKRLREEDESSDTSKEEKDLNRSAFEQNYCP